MSHEIMRRSGAARTCAVALALLLVTGIVLTGNKETALGQPPAKRSAAHAVKGSGSARLSVPAKEARIPEFVRKGLDPKDEEVIKAIDDKLAEAWKANNVQPADICSDYEFIRRASLDIIGRIPRPEEMIAFFNHSENQPQKDHPELGPISRRAWFVEHLLASDDYPRNWGNIWTNWLLTRSGGAFGRGKYHDQMRVWVEDQFALNTSYDKFVKELITAKGRATDTDNGSVLFILAHVGEPTGQGKQQEEGQFNMVPITARMTRLFLGIQTQCTQCHDHPFDNRLQSEFWGVNAFLRQATRVGNPARRRGQQQEDLELRDSNNNKDGKVFYEKRNGVLLEVPATFLGNKKPDPTANRREELARLVVENEMFPKAIVNRMWGHFFAKGFCNPVDDFNSKNEIVHPELFDEVSGKLKHYGYDMRQLIRWICNSKAYNLRSVANATNDKPEQEVLFSRMPLKAMSPEQLFESLMTATLEKTQVASKDKDKKQKEDKDKKQKERNELKERWMNRLVANFGDDEGNEITFSGTVVQALLLMNGDDINNSINNKEEGVVARVLKKNGNNIRANITDLYLHTLNRKPTEKEFKKIFPDLALLPGSYKRDKDPAAPWHDLMWALLNSAEFILNH